MLKVSTGIDIIEIERVKKSIENTNNRFIKEVFTEKEIAYCESKKNAKYTHYAARFAAKEAVFKAVSFMLENKYDLGFQNIEILNKDDGKPYINFKDISFSKVLDIDISISHSREYAVANVTLIYEG